jgi:hypothetical protein
MAFDARAFLAAYTAPVYIDRAGAAHTGQILSRFEALAIEDDANTMDQGTMEERRAKAERVLTTFLPTAPAAVQEILGLPNAAFEEVMAHFFGCQKPPKPTSASAAEGTPAPSSPVS